MTFFWYSCPKCKRTISTALAHAELYCIPCGKVMQRPKDEASIKKETPAIETPLFGRTS
jgi:DNA-directed RNA polymerase subunit RPC12/RpoP